MPSIKKNFFYSAILTSSNYIFPLLVYPYVSRVLGVDKIGICNFVNSIVQYFVLISMFGISAVGIREIAKAKNNEIKLNSTFNSIFCTNAIFTIIAVIALVYVIIFVPSLLNYRKLLFIGIIKVISNFFLIEWLFKGLEDFKYITVRTIFVKIIYVCSIFIFVRDENDYTMYYLLTVLMITVNSIFNGFYSRRYIRYSFRNINIKVFFIPICIMGVNAMMISMYTTFNTAFLGFVAGDVQVGYYSTATTLYGALLALFSSFTGVMLPRMSSLIAEGRYDKFKVMLDKSANILFSFSFPFVFLFIVFSSEIINIYAGKGYEGAIIPMCISMPLMIVIGYEQVLINQGLLPLGKNKSILITSIIGAIVGIGFSFLLVKKFESVGSSIVWAISELAVLTTANFFMYKYIKFSFPISTFFKQFISYVPLLIPLIIIHHTIKHKFISLVIGGILVILYTYFVQRYVFHQSEIVNLSTKFKSYITHKK